MCLCRRSGRSKVSTQGRRARPIGPKVFNPTSGTVFIYVKGHWCGVWEMHIGTTGYGAMVLAKLPENSPLGVPLQFWIVNTIVHLTIFYLFLYDMFIYLSQGIRFPHEEHEFLFSDLPP